MKKTLILLFAALLGFSAPAAKADDTRLLRFPSTDGKYVLFSYAGDLWKVPVSGGKAVRLTSHVGYEMFGKFSPDGKKIAFTGEYDGNREVYIMDADGGKPERLTYTSTNGRDDLGDRMGPNNIVMNWTPDGKSIVYRNRIGESFVGKLWKVSPEGGMPTEIKLPEGGFCSWSPDGKRLAYNRVMREFRTWKYYRGGMADDIWIYDPAAEKVERLLENPAQDIFPMWVGDEIYFASDRDLTMNLFVYDTKTGKTTKVTDYKDYDVKFPSTDGKTIVYEHAGYIYRLDPATKKSTRIHIEVDSEDLYARTELRHVDKNLTAASIPGGGERIAVTARGEVFDVPVGTGVTRNLTRTPGANEREATWSPDGKWIAYISDRTGETEVWLSPADGGEARQLTKNNDTYIRGLDWTPDSKTVVYTDRKNRIVAVDVSSAKKRTVVENPESEFRSVTFSPDSKWITYTRPAANQMSIVYVCELASGKEYPVTERWYDSGSPAFSADGKYLIFNSSRDLNPIYSNVEWNYAYTSMGGVYMAMLAKDTPSPLIPQDAVIGGGAKEETPSEPAPRAGKKNGKEAPEADKGVSVRIDPEGLSERIIKLPLSNGNARNFYCDGKKLWFGGMGGTRVFDFSTGKEDSVCDATFSYNFGAKKALFMKGRGSIYVADFPSLRVSLDKPVDMGDMVAEIDYSREWPQLFDEVWRAFRDGYYEENMNGRDWKAVKAKYEVFLPYVKTRLDLNYVIGEMISEVGTGHAYITPGEKPEAEKIQMGLLGARLSRDGSGFYRIDEILPGASYRESLRSPLAEPGMKVKEGDYIIAINGVSTASVDNIYKLLVGKAGVLTELTVNGSATEGGTRIVVRPVADEEPLYHYRWVQNNIRTVEEKSGGKVGYIYIPDMGAEGLNEFVRYYYPQLDKEALIIDDRNNGGGNVSPMIIERLQREAYNMTMSRGSTMTSTVPEGTHTGPKVLLINKYSSSDGDLFPWRFKANKLGTAIGTRTWGGIIGISGSLPYMDGTDVRVPFFTNYDAKTGEWIVENHGVDPDIFLENDPVKEYNGEDEQLNKAIETALEQIKTRKALPGVPPARTFKDLHLNGQPDDSIFLK